ncbi:unnamed protein product [Dicrocoelium dendriticum]|nr:unnamed protein product [Dicrocoelium dendriticum]
MKRSSSCHSEFERQPKCLRRSLSDPVDKELVDSIGIFHTVPLELQYKIFSFLTIDDLITLAGVTSRMKFTIDLFVNSSQCALLREFRSPHSGSTDLKLASLNRLCDKFKKAGCLFRVLSSSLSTSLRLNFLEQQLIRHMCQIGEEQVCTSQTSTSHSVSGISTEAPTASSTSCRLGCLRCPALYLYGHFLQTFTSDWLEVDKKKLFYQFVHKCFGDNFWRRLTTIVCENPGQDPSSELAIRLFLRRVFLDPVALPVPITGGAISHRSPTSKSGSNQFANWRGTSHKAIHSLSMGVQTEHPEEPHIRPSGSSVLPSDCSSYQSDHPTSAPLVVRASCSGPAVVLNHPHSKGPLWPAAQPLMHVLHSYPLVHQARIVFILYGPLHKGRLMWRTMCENTAADSEQLTACFGELGSVLHNMLESGAWTHDETLSILNEITIVPEEWLAENVACLLYTSGPRLASMLITQKAESGQIGELAITLTSLCIIRVKIRAALTDLIGLVGEACRAAQNMDRRLFLDQLARAFQDVIVDLYETDELEDRVEDFSIILKAQAEFMRALMARVYEE